MDRKIKKKKLTPKRIVGILFAAGFLGFCFYQFVLGDYSIKLNVQRERITISPVKEGRFQEYPGHRNGYPQKNDLFGRHGRWTR